MLSVANTNPNFSVITPTYNCGEFIHRSYYCLKSQSYSDWEWIVVDDGSTDNTFETLKGIADPRIRVFRYQENRGRGHARSLALEQARGAWMVAWDVDDIFFPNRLSEIAQAKEEGFDFCCSYASLLTTGLEVKGLRTFHLDASDTTRVFVHSTLGCSLSLAREIGYAAEHRAGEDSAITWALARKYQGKWVEEALMGYVEEREVNLAKSISSNLSQFRIARQLYHRKILDIGARAYLRMCVKWSLKLAALQAMRVYPPLFLKTIGCRRDGESANNLECDSQKLEFLIGIRQREKTGVWNLSGLPTGVCKVSDITK